MRPKNARILIFFSMVLLAVAVLFTQPSTAHAISGEWVELPNARGRLVVTGDPMQGRLTAGLEIELDREWKTYWRFPGDSGIPLTLDWSASSNIKRSEVLYPAPVRFSDEYGQSAGYKNRVLFPIELDLTQSGRPTKIAFDAFLGICREVCIPVNERFAITVPPLFATNLTTTDAIKRAMIAVPQALPAILMPEIATRATNENDVPIVSLKFKTSDGNEIPEVKDIFIEGPETWFLSLPKHIPGVETGKTWNLSLNGVPRNVEPWGTEMRLTIVTSQGAYETTFVLKPPI